MKIVLFDLLYSQPLADTKFHGGGEYIKAVFQAFVKRCRDTSCEIHISYNPDLYLEDWIVSDINQCGMIMHHVKSSSDIYSLLELLSNNGEVRFFEGLSYAFKTPFPKNVYSIGTCHGLRTIEKPYDPIQLNYSSSIFKRIKDVLFQKFRGNKMQRFYKAGFLKNFSVFDCIVAVSHHTEYAIKAIFPGVEEKTKLITCYTPAKKIDISSNSVSDDGYILMISANRWLKNVYSGIRAVDTLYSNGQLGGIKTHVLGNIPESIKSEIVNKRMFEFYGYIEPEELEYQYSHCSLFLYPTLNEGFGLPPFEAMKYGKTCIISAVCSLPEIYGDAVYYCNPYDILEIENRVLYALNNKKTEAIIDQRVKAVQEIQRADTNKLCDLILGRV